MIEKVSPSSFGIRSDSTGKVDVSASHSMALHKTAPSSPKHTDRNVDFLLGVGFWLSFQARNFLRRESTGQTHYEFTPILTFCGFKEPPTPFQLLG